MMAGCSPNKSPQTYPIESVLQEHAKYVVFIKELQSQVQTLQDFRSRVLQAFPHLDIGLYCTMAMTNLFPKRHLKSRITDYTDISGQYQVKQTKSNLPKKGGGVHVQTRKLHDRSLGNSFRNKGKRNRVVCRGKVCLENNDGGNVKGNGADENECDMGHETSVGTSSSFPSVTNPQHVKLKCDKMKLDGSCCAVHRQDSGFSTDGKDKLVSSNPLDEFESGQKAKTDEEDELMNILDIIEQRSVTMKTLVEQKVHEEESSKVEHLSIEIDRLHFEKEVLIDRIFSLEIDHKLYREEINRLKDSLIEAEVSKRIMEDRLDAAISEREQLGTRINRLHSKFVNKIPPSVASYAQLPTDSTLTIRADGNSSKYCQVMNSISGKGGFHSPNSLPDRLCQPAVKLKVHVERTKVSAILQESRTLELQKQLLVSVIRNEVVKCRMEQQEREWNQRAAKWQQFEIHTQKEIEALKRMNGDLQNKIQKISTELRMERTKRKVLERALHAAYRDMTSISASAETGKFSPKVDDFTKENVLGSTKKKQNNVLKQRIVNSYLGQKSNAVESDSRFRTGGKPEQMTNVYANNNEIFQSWLQQDESAIVRNKFYQSSFRKLLLDASESPSEQDVGASQNSGNIQLSKNVPSNVASICNHTTAEQFGSHWEWSYHIENVPEKSVTS